jgi:AcrR family transcriptional regulator
MNATASPLDGLRSDARRNHQQVLEAARHVVLERGPGVALEEIAKVAGVGIGTLYRRFGDRAGLLKAVALDALAQTRSAAEQALADHEVGFDALAAYMRAALELRTAAVIPQVMDLLDMNDPDLGPERDAGAAVLDEIIDRGHDDGSLAETIAFADVGTVLVRLSRPLPGALGAETDLSLARRHLSAAGPAAGSRR